MYNKQRPAITDLQQRLYSILPEYRPISEQKGDEEGTFKAVDFDGNVFLVDFENGDRGPRRCKRFFCDYAGLIANSSLKTEPRQCAADENWVLTLLG
jgi:hypothetical protein